jgi:hypothetical protein
MIAVERNLPMIAKILIALAVLTSPALAEERKYQIVSAADLMAAVESYIDKDIELRGMKCFLAVKGSPAAPIDFRCLAGELLIRPLYMFGEDRWSLVDNCRTEKQALASPKCAMTVRLNFSKAHIYRDHIPVSRDPDIAAMMHGWSGQRYHIALEPATVEVRREKR